jgi:hypothetical protein
MSDMSREHKTFTVRDLSRETAAVLEVCQREGTVSIRTRSGEEFELTSKTKKKPKKPEKKLSAAAQAWVDCRDKMRAHRQRLGLLPLEREQMDKLGRMIAGE